MRSSPATPTGTPADVAAIVDRGVVDAHPDLLDQIQRYLSDHRDVLRLAGPILIVPGGEAVKNDIRHIDEILRVIQDAGLCRHSYVLAIGGGAVLDAVGYAAATAHRGVRLVRIPTTVLAQDDSAVGVKNGINAFGKKNYLGTFAPPYAVINDFNFLPTLIDRDWRGGIAEAVKAGLIRDAAIFRLHRTTRGSAQGPGPRGHGARGPAVGRAFTWRTSPPVAIRSSSARRGRWTTGTGRRTSWSS